MLQVPQYVLRSTSVGAEQMSTGHLAFRRRRVEQINLPCSIVERNACCENPDSDLDV